MLRSHLPCSVMEMKDAATVHAAYDAVRTLIKVAGAYTATPLLNNGEGETAGDYLCGILHFLQGEAECLADRAAELEVTGKKEAAFKARVALAYELDYPGADDGAAISRAATALAAALT